ncbi:winged helix-turn-helix domain-containing protein [Pantoea anthophila]|uniref:winged helix-turn-helix domain-containing protein n=1 Tax=Pantoea anthophila TaxID=470931 RepID=UPI00277E91C4|nr:hypothetical protein [Pantoea anthophila]MDQ1215026.1 hypothetical protein [Pantoea anthophila]
MEIVWEKNGMLVSPNTFYQNISILRKGLKKVGLHDDPVVTIPRVGLTLASGTDIKKRSSEHLVTLCEEKTHFMDENALALELPDQKHLIQSQHTEETEFLAGQPAESLPAQSAKIPSFNIAIQKKSSSFILWALGLAAILFLIITVRNNHAMSHSRNYFGDYLFLSNVAGCRVFIADKDSDSDGKARTLALVRKFSSSCNHHPWVYITHFHTLPRISVIRCNKPMNEENQCISEYHFRGLKQDG